MWVFGVRLRRCGPKVVSSFLLWIPGYRVWVFVTESGSRVWGFGGLRIVVLVAAANVS